MEESVWRVDADASLQAVLDDRHCPALLSQALMDIHSWQLRNETVLSRALKSSRLFAHLTAALLALGAVVTIEDEGGKSEVRLEDLARDNGKGKVVSLSVPQVQSMRWGESHVARTPSDEPIVAAFAVVSSKDGVVEEARIVLSGASPGPAWVADAAQGLLDHPLSDASIEEVVSALLEEVRPVGDYRGSEEYRREMAGVLTRRALEDCLHSEVGDE